MNSYRLEDIAAWLGVPCPAPATLSGGVSIDSRTLSPGQLFVAIRGESHDGHAYLSVADAAGMAAAIVDHAAAQTGLGRLRAPVLVVADTQAALGRLGAYARSQRPGLVVGVTGSNGKTTSKELLAAALSAKGPVHKTRGNLNNHFGVPLTLMAWPESAPCAVVEMGMSALGEIAALCELARPDVGLVTCVAAAHLEGLGTLANVATAKAELFAGLPDAGVAVLNDDDAPLNEAAARVIGTRGVLRFGHAARCDVQLTRCRSVVTATADGGLSPRLDVALQVDGRAYEAALPVLGAHNGMNVAGAVAAAWACAVAPDDALAGMAQVSLPASRAALVMLPHIGARVVDDCYNANPGSVAAALATLVELGAPGRSVAVLGDMLELGPTAEALHETAGRQAAQAGVPVVWGVGRFADALIRGAAAHGAATRAFADVAALTMSLSGAVAPGDTWLVKGSRGMRLERVVAALVALDAAQGGTTPAR